MKSENEIINEYLIRFKYDELDAIFQVLNDYYEYYYVIYKSESDILIKNIDEISDELIELLHDELTEINIIEYVEIYADGIKIKLKK